VTPAAPQVQLRVEELLDDFEAAFDRLGDSGELVWVAIGAQRFLLVNGAARVREVLIDRSAELVKPRRQTVETGPPQPEAPSPIPIPAFRRALAHGLAGRDGDLVAALADAAVLETREWTDGATVALMPALRRIAIRGTLRGLFAVEPTDEEVTQLEGAMRWFDDAPRVSTPRRFKGLSGHALRRPLVLGQLGAVSKSLVRRADRSRPSELTAVVSDLAEHSPELGERERLGLIGELLLGAAGPLTQTAGWMLWRFATERAEVEPLRAEWDEALAGDVPLDEAVGRCRRTEAFVREVTRFHPTNPRITRVAVVDTEVGGEAVPAHTRVVLNVKRVNREPSVYAEPERFDSARWLDGRPAASTFAYVSFGSGERRCPGEHVGLSGLVGLLPTLVRDRDVEIGEIAASRTGRHQLADDAAVALRPR
jgi:epi-isozizaene 5-monooxygenase / beta-farnesene synthase